MNYLVEAKAMLKAINGTSKSIAIFVINEKAKKTTTTTRYFTKQLEDFPGTFVGVYKKAVKVKNNKSETECIQGITLHGLASDLKYVNEKIKQAAL